MGKKQDTKAREQVVAQRSAQLRVVEAAAGYTPEELEVMLPEWRVFLTAFPTVQAAIEAVSAGRAVEWSATSAQRSADRFCRGRTVWWSRTASIRISGSSA